MARRRGQPRERLKVFHYRCLKGIFGITATQQRSEHLSSAQIAKQFGMEESLGELITARRLRWLGHVARTEFQEDAVWVATSAKTCPWYQDEGVRKDLKEFGIEEGSWYKVAQDRGSWRGRCRVRLENATEKRLKEDELRRRRRRKATEGRDEDSQPGEPLPCLSSVTHASVQDIARHRCVTTRPKGQVMSGPSVGST